MTQPHRYQVLIEPSAQKALQKLPKEFQRRIISKIVLLADNPRPSGSVKLTGADAYRIRVGDYRIIYAIVDERLVVLVVEIGHRREIYRNW